MTYNAAPGEHSKPAQTGASPAQNAFEQLSKGSEEIDKAINEVNTKYTVQNVGKLPATELNEDPTK